MVVIAIDISSTEYGASHPSRSFHDILGNVHVIQHRVHVIQHLVYVIHHVVSRIFQITCTSSTISYTSSTISCTSSNIFCGRHPTSRVRNQVSYVARYPTHTTISIWRQFLTRISLDLHVEHSKSISHIFTKWRKKIWWLGFHNRFILFYMNIQFSRLCE